jgi:hypothetical protein
VTEERLPFFDDFENDFAVVSRGRGIQDGPNRLCRSALFADDASEVFFGDFQLHYGRKVTFGLFNFDGVGLINQGFRQMLD